MLGKVFWFNDHRLVSSTLAALRFESFPGFSYAWFLMCHCLCHRLRQPVELFGIMHFLSVPRKTEIDEGREKYRF
ncbi:MAG: hypothetical protein WDM76_04890 [Limisphaerales bacterium]